MPRCSPGPNTDAVLGRFTVKILEDESAAGAQLTPERFKLLVNEVKGRDRRQGQRNCFIPFAS